MMYYGLPAWLSLCITYTSTSSTNTRKRSFSRMCYVLLCNRLALVFSIWMPTWFSCSTAYACTWLLSRRTTVVHDYDCRAATSLGFGIACVSILGNNVQQLLMSAAIVACMPCWALWWPRARHASFTNESVHWWPRKEDASPQDQTNWKLIGSPKKFSTEEAGNAAESLPQHIQRINGQLFYKVETDGDGACAIHSVFGAPSNEHFMKLFVENARARAVS